MKNLPLKYWIFFLLFILLNACSGSKKTLVANPTQEFATNDFTTDFDPVSTPSPTPVTLPGISELWTSITPTIDWTEMQAGKITSSVYESLVITAKNSQARGQIWGLISNGTRFENRLLQSLETIRVGFSLRKSFLADLNGDGIKDYLAIENGNGQLWVSLSNGSSFGIFSAWGTFTSNLNWLVLSVGDVTGDSKEDLIGFDPDTKHFYVGSSNGSDAITNLDFGYLDPVLGRPDENYPFKVGDFNGDGKQDISFIAYPTGRSITGLSNGSQFTFYSNISFASPLSREFFYGDFLGNSRMGLGTYSSMDGLVSTSDQGLGLLVDLDTFSTSENWKDFKVGRFTGTSRDEILAHDLTNGQWWLSKPQGNRFGHVLFGVWDNTIQWKNILSGKFSSGSHSVVGTAPDGQVWLLRKR